MLAPWNCDTSVFIFPPLTANPRPRDHKTHSQLGRGYGIPARSAPTPQWAKPHPIGAIDRAWFSTLWMNRLEAQSITKKQHAQVSRQHSARHISPTGRSTSRQCPHHRGQHAHNSSSRTPRKLFQVASWMRNATFWPHMTSSSPPNCIEILPRSTCEANPEMAFWQGLKAQARFGGVSARLVGLRSPPETRKKPLGFW